jgi:hypothetical protein
MQRETNHHIVFSRRKDFLEKLSVAQLIFIITLMRAHVWCPTEPNDSCPHPSAFLEGTEKNLFLTQNNRLQSIFHPRTSQIQTLSIDQPF